MKIALCLYGYYNNIVDNNAGDKGFEYIQNQIMKTSDDIDIFIHSWDTKNQDNILNKYSPKKYLIEPQINFNSLATSVGIDEAKINIGFNRDRTIYKQCTVNASLSFFYSRSKSIQFAVEYAKENDFVYDCVISCRFDLGQRSGWHTGYNVSLMEFDPTLDMNYIYSAMWKQLNAGYADQWFFSNQSNMEKLSTMFDCTLKDYFIIGGEYNETLVNGWPDSNIMDEFSNEILNKNECQPIKYPQWQMINNHLLHKWHFIRTGLYNNSKFIGKSKP